jgi:hypothetical protein
MLHGVVAWHRINSPETGTRTAAPGTLQDPAVLDSCVSLGIGPSFERTWLRDRARREQPARSQRLQQRVFGSIESAPPADRGTSGEAGSARSRRSADRGAPDARRKAGSVTRSDAGTASRDGPGRSAISPTALSKQRRSEESSYRKNPEGKPPARRSPTRERKIWNVKRWPKSATC